jgi:dihydroflavonol-4-reductase
MNQKVHKEKASIIHKNDLAKKDLGMQFKPVKTTLNNYTQRGFKIN